MASKLARIKYYPPNDLASQRVTVKSCRGYWTPAINYCPIERDWERKYRNKKKIMYHDYFSNFAWMNCAFFSDSVPVHRVVRAVESKMATGCKFLSLAASVKSTCRHLFCYGQLRLASIWLRYWLAASKGLLDGVGCHCLKYEPNSSATNWSPLFVYFFLFIDSFGETSTAKHDFIRLKMLLKWKLLVLRKREATRHWGKDRKDQHTRRSKNVKAFRSWWVPVDMTRRAGPDRKCWNKSNVKRLGRTQTTRLSFAISCFVRTIPWWPSICQL